MEDLIVDGNSCNDETFIVLELSSFVKLKLFEVGDYSFAYVNKVKLIGLKMLERVLIGANSFTKHKNSVGNYPNHHFYLKDCERLRELKIGSCSFNDFTVCEIANVPSLEVIEVNGANFCCASLELKSDDDEMK